MILSLAGTVGVGVAVGVGAGAGLGVGEGLGAALAQADAKRAPIRITAMNPQNAIFCFFIRNLLP